ncbi:ubiquitin carboxyl-terminal hydrolase 19-like isoform X2 [Zingiber officinale]|nr:ubiquitin carboxyl-terminal hydrolase 19-like isoform X2 [Zingiber officinale]
MRGTTEKSLGYKLYSVVVHLDVMNAAFSSHYLCYVNNIQGKWFKMDDAVVKPVEVEQIMSHAFICKMFTASSKLDK